MTVKDVIEGFHEDVQENRKRDAYADELYQEAIRIGMELNSHYHTPEEVREIMGKLTGKKMRLPDGRLCSVHIMEKMPTAQEKR